MGIGFNISKKPTGSIHTGKTVTIKPIGQGGDYFALEAALAEEFYITPDVTAIGGPLNFYVCGDWSSFHSKILSLNIPNYVTDENCYINIYTDSANRASYFLDESKYTFINAGLQINSPYTRITGLQMTSTNNQILNNLLIGETAHNVIIDSVYLTHTLVESNTVKNNITINSTGPVCIRNSVLLNHDISHDIAAAINITSDTTLYLYNNILVGQGYGIYGSPSNTVNINYYNNYAYGMVKGFPTGTESWTFSGQNNFSNIDTSPTVPYNNTSFTNTTSGSENLSLADDSYLIGAGTNLSAVSHYPFTWDIDGSTRKTDWDVGAVTYGTMAIIGNADISQNEQQALINAEMEILINGELNTSQSKQTLSISSRFKNSGALSSSQRKQTMNIVSKHHNIGIVSVSQSKQVISGSGSKYASIRGHFNVLQHKETMNIVSHVRNNYGVQTLSQKRQSVLIRSHILNTFGALSIGQSKQSISIGAIKYYKAKISIKQKAQSMTSLAKQKNSGNISSSQKSQLLNAHSHIINYFMAVNTSQSKQSISISSKVISNRIHVRMIQNKQNMLASGNKHIVGAMSSVRQKSQIINIHSHIINYFINISMNQDSQNTNVSGYVLHHPGEIRSLQNKQSISISGVEKINGASSLSQIKQNVNISGRYHYSSSVEMDQNVQGIKVISYIVNNYGQIGSQQNYQRVGSSGIQKVAGNFNIGQNKQTSDVAGYVINFYTGIINCEENKQRTKFEGTVTIQYKSGDEFILKERKNVKLYAVWSKNP